MTSSFVNLARRTFVVLAATLAVAAFAGPARADVPEGWAEPTTVSGLEFLLLLVIIPLGLALVITVLVYVPSLVRGESLAPGNQEPENQWLGGPSKSPAELTVGDSDSSEAGGASARW